MKLSISLLCLALTSCLASDDFPLDKSLVRNCNPDDPCDICQGDCDDNEDCLGDLVCYQKDATDVAVKVPGCKGTDKSRTDFCVMLESIEEEFIPESIEENIEGDDEVVTIQTSPPLEEVPPPIGPVGFEAGMAAEIAGMWVGDEKYNYEGDILDYCSNAFFQPGASGKNYLAWQGSYLGNSTESCGDMGVDPMTGAVNNDLYHNTGVESYLLGIGYKACLTEIDCDYDVTTSEGFEDYEVVAKSCGVHLKENLLSGGYDCELYQISRVEKTTTDAVETLDVAVLTYGSTWTGGFANFTCPTKPTFDLEELTEDILALGTTRFVRQLGYGSYAPINLTDWECTV